MKAAVYDRTGPPEVLRVVDLPDPVPGPGEVLVRVHASGINPSDTKRRAGWRGAALDHPMVVPHSDGAGVIEAVGPDVPDRVGERVWLYNAQRGRALGTCAELCALPSEQAVPLPGIGFEEGACLGVPAQTAHRAVRADGAVTGQRVLVNGVGAVGLYAIQWAALGGATVVAATSAPKADRARSAGARHVVDRHGDVVAEVRALVGAVDRIVEVDLGANLAVDEALIAENGVIASYSSSAVPEPVLPYYPLAHKGVTLRLVQAYNLPRAARALAIADIAATALRHDVAARFPLAEAAAAHRAAEAGLGKVVVCPQLGAVR